MTRGQYGDEYEEGEEDSDEGRVLSACDEEGMNLSTRRREWKVAKMMTVMRRLNRKTMRTDGEEDEGHDEPANEIICEEDVVETYQEEYATDSDDDQPLEPLTAEDQLALQEIRAFERIVGRHPSIHEFADLSKADGAILDGDIFK
uniref:Uncharacterized protein n=1 Tax=Oryza brachyantha TaxID=4533 RepID=J3M499_ORYBR